MSNSTNNKKSNSGFNIDKMTTFVKKNVKYISAGILTVALVVVLAVTVLNNKDESSAKENKENQVVQQEQKEEKKSKDQEEKDEKENKEDELKEDEYEENVQPEVQELMSTYYNAYAVGDVKKLDSITESLSDMEKSYIKMINKYVESYDDITCYTKEGLEEDSYMVSVTFNMHFHDVEGGLPGMDFFYIRSNDADELYIDNLYSSFNREIKEQKTEEEIDKLIKVFEEGEDVQQLSKEFQDKYDQVVKEDKALKKMANTVSKAIREWKDSYSEEEKDKNKDKKEEKDKKDKNSEEQKDKPKENQNNTDEQANNEEQNNTNEAQEDNSEEQNNQPEENQEGNSEDNTSDESQNNEGSSINYVPEGTVLTANDGYNVRVSMNESAEVVGTTAIGDSIKVILSYAEGWTKVEWNGQTGYIRTDLLLNN